MVKVRILVLKIKNNWQSLTEYWNLKKIDLNQDLTKTANHKINLRKVDVIKTSKKVDHNQFKKEVEVEIKEVLVNGQKRLIRRLNKLISNS